MRKKALVIGGIVTAVALAGGWALAQSGPGFGPPFMHGAGVGGMGRGMMHGMGPGMMQHMGPGMGQGMGFPGGPGMVRGAAGPVFADPARLEALKTDLGIKPAQEQAWSKYAKVVQDAAAEMKTTRESTTAEAAGKLGPQERFAFATRMHEQASKHREAVAAAANELLATLDDAQKAKAQQTLPGLAFSHGTMRGAFMGGPPWHRN